MLLQCPLLDDYEVDAMSRWMDVAAAVFALLAAVFWFLSAAGKLPPIVAYWDRTPDSDPFYQAIRFSALMNTIAALCSGVSAALFGIKLFFLQSRVQPSA
jgi:hypothetical protein